MTKFEKEIFMETFQQRTELPLSGNRTHIIELHKDPNTNEEFIVRYTLEASERGKGALADPHAGHCHTYEASCVGSDHPPVRKTCIWQSVIFGCDNGKPYFVRCTECTTPTHGGVDT